MLGQKTKQNAVAGYDETVWCDHLRAAIRAGSVGLLLATVDLRATALKGGLIQASAAPDLMADVGALPLVDAVAAITGASEALHVREGWALLRGRAI